MTPDSPWVAALACVAVALITLWLLEKISPSKLTPGRYLAVDGLRGYLALFVFLHHACVWYFYRGTGRWTAPPSHLFTYFGEGSVVLFFMITAFLFYGKLLDGRAGGGVDWSRLFISRVMRLFPLYLFAMVLIVGLVGMQSGWQLREPVSVLLSQLADWLYLSLPGAPPINLTPTNTITAGVTWSLPYEWVWYFFLPWLALLLGLRPSWRTLLLSFAVCGSAVLLNWEHRLFRILPFVGGVCAAYAARSIKFRQMFAGPKGAVVVVACLTIAMTSTASAYKIGPLLLLTLAFCIIASGNSLFGVLHLRLSRALGELAYSIYLLHGMLLFITFTELARQEGSPISVVDHWMHILLLTPILITLCRLTFRLIETPGNRQVDLLTQLWGHRTALARRPRQC